MGSGSVVRGVVELTAGIIGAHPSPSIEGAVESWSSIATSTEVIISQKCMKGLHKSKLRACSVCARTVISCCIIIHSWDSAIFLSSGETYSSECRRVIGYQKGTTDAFERGSKIISYVNGVSLTHGAAGSCQHIWQLCLKLIT